MTGKDTTTVKRIYPAINSFKLLAALFVIMIHTSPLTSVSRLCADTNHRAHRRTIFLYGYRLFCTAKSA